MKIRARTAASLLAMAATGCIASAAHAGIVFSDPGLFENQTDRFEARIRLDGGNSQTWKAAFWTGSSLIGTAGNYPNVFSDGALYEFSFSYDATSGQALLQIADMSVNQTIALDPGMSLAAVRLAARSESGTGRTLLSHLQLATNTGPAQSVSDFMSDTNEVWANGPTAWFDGPTDSFVLTGNVAFDWDNGANLQGDRFKFSAYLVQGNAIPAAPTLALLAAGLVGLRRRRMR